MSKKTGSLSINSENIFSIVKKWLYSDRDIVFKNLDGKYMAAKDLIKKAEKKRDAGEVREGGSTVKTEVVNEKDGAEKQKINYYTL